MSVKFAIAPDVDAMIDLVDSSNKVLASAESIDVITCYGEAVDQANKLGKEALEVYADMLHEKYNVPLTKSQAITLFNYANDLMEDLKKILPIAEAIRYYGVAPSNLHTRDLKLLALFIPTLKAREIYETLLPVNSSTIKGIVMRAFNDEKFADSVENMFLLREDRSKKS